MADIILHNATIDVHDGGTLTAVGIPKPVVHATISTDIVDNSTLIFVNEDISTWKIGDTVVFAPLQTSPFIIDSRKIVSVVTNNIIQIDSPLSTQYTIADTHPQVPHISNVTKDVKISGHRLFSRGSIRTIDRAKLELQHINFARFGLPFSTSRQGIGLANNKEHTVIIDSCSLNNDACPTTNFVVGLNRSSTITDLVFTNNIVYNTWDKAIDIRPATVRPSIITIHDNMFIRGSIAIANIQASTLTSINNIHVGCEFTPAVSIDSANIAKPWVDDNIVFANKNEGLLIIHPSNTLFQNITSSFNKLAAIKFTSNTNITARELIAHDNFFEGINLNNINRAALMYNITSVANFGDNFKVHTVPNTFTSPLVTLRNSVASNSITANGISYNGTLPLIIHDNIINSNNVNGVLAFYYGTPSTYINTLSVHHNDLKQNVQTGIDSIFNHDVFLSPNCVTITDNTIEQSTDGFRSNNIFGTISGNAVSQISEKEYHTSIGNKDTLVARNSSNIINFTPNYTFLDIYGGLNYREIKVKENVFTSTFSENSFKLEPPDTGIGVYKFDGPSILRSWPLTGVELNAAARLLDPNIKNTTKESILAYIDTDNIKYVRISYTGQADIPGVCRLTVSINDTVSTVIAKPSPVTIALPEKNTVGRKFTKLLITYEVFAAGDIVRSTIITNIEYSFDDVQYKALDPSRCAYNVSLHNALPSNTSPAANLSRLQYDKSNIDYIAIGNTDFRNFKVYNNINVPFIDLKFKLTTSVVVGSYFLDNNYITVDAASVFAFYQPRVEKTVGISNTIYPNAGVHYKHGYILSDNTVSVFNEQNNAVSERLYPHTTSDNKLKSGKKYVAVEKNEFTTVYVYVKISSTYKGNKPRLMVSRNYALGISEDLMLDEHRIAPGGWQFMVGTIPTPLPADGVLEFYVDCDGTTGFVLIDSWASPTSSFIIVPASAETLDAQDISLELPAVTPTNTPTNTVTPSITPTINETPTTTPTNTPTNTSTPTNTPSVTPTTTCTATVTPTVTETYIIPSTTPTNTTTPTPIITQTPTPTTPPTPTPTPSNTPTISLTPSVTKTQTPTKTETPTQTPTITNTPSYTATPTITPTSEETPTPTPTNTGTPDVTPTTTPTQTTTPSNEPTSTPTQTNTETPTSPTPTPTFTPTPSVTPSFTPTPSVTPSITASNTQTPSITPSFTPTNTPTPNTTPTTIFVTPTMTPTISVSAAAGTNNTITAPPGNAIKFLLVDKEGKLLVSNNTEPSYVAWEDSSFYLTTLNNYIIQSDGTADETILVSLPDYLDVAIDLLLVSPSEAVLIADNPNYDAIGIQETAFYFKTISGLYLQDDNSLDETLLL